MKVHWTQDAINDRQLIINYIEDRNPFAAIKLLQNLIKRADTLSDFPNRGRPGLITGTRELLVVRPYIIVYEVGDDTVTILRIWHSAQDR